MWGSVLLYAGLASAALGCVALFRPMRSLRLGTRRRAAMVVAAGCGIVAIAMLLPAPAQRAETPASRLDEIVPEWQFSHRHTVRVHADPKRLEAAIREVTAREIRLFRLLTWLRNPSWPCRERPQSILAAPADRPILEVALESGFFLLANVPQREIVLGAVAVAPRELAHLTAEERDRLRAGWSAEWLAALDEPGYAKAVMAFLIEGEGDGWSRLRTETRVFATDATARRRFAVYWRVIYPGSALIRRNWLEAIRRRAETPYSPSSQPKLAGLSETGAAEYARRSDEGIRVDSGTAGRHTSQVPGQGPGRIEVAS